LSVNQQVSLKGFMRVIDQPYWRLRDYLRGEEKRQRRDQALSQAAAEVTAAAAEDTSYGYRRVYQHLRGRGVEIGRECVRRLMGELGLQPPPPRKKQREKHEVTAVEDWPEGRRLQIDATRLKLDDGVAWVYLVEDVKTRQCLAASVASNLSQERAAQTLLDGHQQLTARGLVEPRLVQSDGGSDFTSHHFQQVCEHIGNWIRSRVAQVGGMGILERLNRTFKHEFMFRHEVTTQAELKALIPAFIRWYNDRRLHSSLGYRTPASALADEVAAIPSELDFPHLRVV
jgi:transposase InsO family protein